MDIWTKEKTNERAKKIRDPTHVDGEAITVIGEYDFEFGTTFRR